MFEKGEFVVYGNKGVCEVTEITNLDIPGAAKEKKYYILSPRFRKSSKFFVPVDSDKTVMRSVTTKEEADALIERIPDIEEIWISNDKLREAQYKETMSSCECEDWIRIIKTLYLRNQERIAQGKKSTSMDDKYLTMAEENLYSELSISLSIDRDMIVDYIKNKVMNTGMTS